MTITLRSFEELSKVGLTEVNEFGYTPEAWAGLKPEQRYKLRNREKIREKQRLAKRAKRIAQGYCQTRAHCDVAMTAEEMAEAKRKKRAEYRAKMTTEQREREREKQREYKKTPKCQAQQKLYKQRIRAARNAAKEAAREAERERRAECAPVWQAENRAALEADPKGMHRRIFRAVKSSWMRDVRDDVAQDIAVALLEGKLSLSEIERTAAEFVRAHFSGRDWFATYDLNMKLPGAEELTLADILSNEHAWL